MLYSIFEISRFLLKIHKGQISILAFFIFKKCIDIQINHRIWLKDDPNSSNKYVYLQFLDLFWLELYFWVYYPKDISYDCILTWGSAKRSVMVACLKLPILVKLELELSKFIVTGHSRSRFCFFSKHMANAHPTAWLRRSPCKKGKQTTHSR